MAKTAAPNLSSEERCEREFERVFNLTAMGSDGLPLSGRERELVRWGWDVAWKYFERHLAEYIES